MIHPLIKSWWLLALCGILYAIFSLMMFLMLSPNGPLILRALVHGRSTVEQLGMLALAAGVCTIAAGIWNLGKDAAWLLVLNGVVCAILGLLIRSTGPVTFRTIAFLIALMAVSIGVYELAAVRTWRGYADEWLLRVAGIVSFGFALAFLAFVFRWLKLDPSPSAQTFNWLGAYFGFSAICMLWLALRHSKPGIALPYSADSPSPVT